MAQRLIDADALIEAMTKFSNATGEDMTHGIFYAHIAPTIAAVPVIRCKDCKWSDWYESMSGECLCYCMKHGSSGHDEDCYCYYAEREETNDDKVN